MSTEVSIAPSAARSRARLTRFSGDLGPWPVLVGLVCIAVGFQAANSAFLTPRNLSNLILQTGTLVVLTLGIMLVLLIGEIDLSIGAVSGVTACVMGIMSALHGWPAWAAIALAIALGALIGLVQSSWIVAFKAPSFIVTLAGMLVWQGAQLILLSDQNGQLRIEDSVITSIASNYLPRPVGWTLTMLVALAGAGWVVVRRYLSQRAGYGTNSLAADLGRVLAIVAAPIVVMLVLDSYLGVPYMLVAVLAVTVTLAVVTGFTVFGRHIYAVGGNAEAARRTGVRVGSLRITVFVIASALAAFAGILEASRGFAVSVNSGGGNAALNAIAAAVIGGTSLFGGRGRVVGALLGALVISSVQNGLALIGQTAATQIIATGLILLAAVTLDMSARRKNKGTRT
ncbi:sugar ABC transporter permease [Dactylosporangium sp. NPDC000244]|uniref:sugar ABC transporter permease n=1 Tax=Dactylosporangium sp. NPDC000244 TaxID=3154365 RepID=UPI003333D7BB